MPVDWLTEPSGRTNALTPLVAATAVEISRAMGWRGDAATLFDSVEGSERLLLRERPGGAVR